MSGTNLIEDLRLLSPPNYGWAAAVAGGLVVAVGFGWAVRRLARSRVGSAAAVVAGVAPCDRALAELERLAPLLCPARSRDYGMASTAVLRRYIEERYGLRAPLQTTEEFLVAAAVSAELPPADRVGLGEFLGLCDLFKFGRFVASVEELGRLHAVAVAFVLRSRPTPAAAAPVQPWAEGGAGER
jgi:hypothetical protein